ncbi:uncharacterized protein LOC121386903 [Gigantopelta aegis]|uniref:uncharacterized protein LOC121386903 n=1 Tax=Gigantopelta aegis TaxID=1735272 RepID=UPI001B88E2D5|nr:uncharacterized protein LOC121386903 [Gigantopelta aegis]
MGPKLSKCHMGHTGGQDGQMDSHHASGDLHSAGPSHSTPLEILTQSTLSSAPGLRRSPSELSPQSEVLTSPVQSPSSQQSQSDSQHWLFPGQLSSDSLQRTLPPGQMPSELGTTPPWLSPQPSPPRRLRQLHETSSEPVSNFDGLSSSSLDVRSSAHRVRPSVGLTAMSQQSTSSHSATKRELESDQRWTSQEGEFSPRRASQDLQAGHRRPSQELQAGQRRPSQDLQAIQRRPSQELQAGQRRPSQDLQAIQRRPSQELQAGQRRPSQELQAGQRRPSQELQAGQRRPSQELQAGQGRSSRRPSVVELESGPEIQFIPGQTYPAARETPVDSYTNRENIQRRSSTRWHAPMIDLIGDPDDEDTSPPIQSNSSRRQPPARHEQSPAKPESTSVSFSGSRRRSSARKSSADSNAPALVPLSNGRVLRGICKTSCFRTRKNVSFGCVYVKQFEKEDSETASSE